MALPETYVPGFHDENAVRRMKYSTLGKTGLQVSKISLGGGALSNFYGEYDESEAISAVQNAIKNGINYIDTAPWYGQGKSETVLGKALKNVPRKAYYIGTKIGRYELSPDKMFDFSQNKTKWSVDNSLKLLGLDYVDIIQVHDLEFAPNEEIILEETLPTLKSVVDEGKAKFVGITGYPISNLKNIIDKSTVEISSILTYTRDTLIDDSLKEYMSFFKSKNIGVIHAAAPSMGLLTNRGPQNWHPASQEVKDLCVLAGKYCEDHGVELGKLAVNYSLNQEGHDTELIGMNTTQLVQSNLDVFYNGLNENETKVLKDINERFFSKIKDKHWEGVELKARSNKKDNKWS